MKTDKHGQEIKSEPAWAKTLSVAICVYPWATTLSLLRCGLGGFFGFARGDFGLQDAILGAAVDLLLAEAVETGGVATCFGHDYLFS